MGNKKRAAAGSRPSVVRVEVLEAEFDRHLHDAMAGFVIGHSERHTRIGDLVAIRIKVQDQTRVVLDEGTKRVVEEVVARELEAQLLALGASQREVLEQRQVSVEEPWPARCRDNVRALLTGSRNPGETISVDVLMGLQPGARIARELRHECDIGSAEDVLVCGLNR